MQAQTEAEGPGKFFEPKGTRIYYHEHGSGYPLLVIPGGGLNSQIAYLSHHPFNPVTEFSDEYRCITPNLRNAIGGQSTGPLDAERPWDSCADDQLALMDHLQIDKFLVIGFCIGGPFIWNLIKRAPDRIVAAVIATPGGWSPAHPDAIHDLLLTTWAEEIVKIREDITMPMAEEYLDRMWRNDDDFVWTVSRDFVRNCHTPVLILPDEVPSHQPYHPYEIAMESADLAPNSQLCTVPWQENEERKGMVVRHVRTFLKANRPAST